MSDPWLVPLVMGIFVSVALCVGFVLAAKLSFWLMSIREGKPEVTVEPDDDDEDEYDPEAWKKK